MAFIRVKSRRGRRYAYLVESRWEPGATSPRQRVLRYLGPEDRVRLEDVPPEMRNEPAVRRWLEARAQAVAPAVDEAELVRQRGLLREALRTPDRSALDELARAGVARMGTWGYLRDVVTRVLYDIGDDWHAERITAADEHLATRAVTDLIRRLRDEEAARASRRKGDSLTVLLATPEGEAHTVALEMLECRLASMGHRTLVLAGGTPRRDLAQRAREARVDLALLSVTGTDVLPEAYAAAEAIADRCPTATVVLGGQAFDDARPPVPSTPRIRHVKPTDGTALEQTLQEVLRRLDQRAT